MNTQKIIEQLKLDPIKKEIFLTMAKAYDESLPYSLYLDPYELTNGVDPNNVEYMYTNFPLKHGLKGTKPELWEEFLAIPQIKTFRDAKIAKIMEAEALKAIARLSRKGAEENAQAISALKEIINISNIIQQNNQQQFQIVMTYMPPIKEDDA